MSENKLNQSLETIEKRRLESIDNLIRNSSTIFGIKTDSYILVVSRGFFSELTIPLKMEGKNYVIQNNICLFGSGFQQDLNLIVKKCREFSIEFLSKYDRNIKVKQLTKEVSKYLRHIWYTNGARPFGIKFILCGFDNDGPSIFIINSRGDFSNVSLFAFGKNENIIMNFLNKRIKKQYNLDISKKLCSRALSESFDSEINNELNAYCLISKNGKVSFSSSIDK
mmetsp:Transcript_11046/g.17365  ORF Transcript_11046/g.17365 Transcript_11046/m.17365 type:complete len:224 (+) Transcript_11046:1691-2362(+)